MKFKKGDIVTYRSGRINHVNKPDKYHVFYDENLEYWGLGYGFGIVKIQRYVKFLGLYKLKTIYERKD